LSDSSLRAHDAPIRESVAQLTARLEADIVPTDEHAFHTPFNVLRRELQERGENVSDELHAEELAFSFHAHDHQDPSTWGLYFGPFLSGFSASGEPWDSPALNMVTPQVLAYWNARATNCPHPVMRARYADLQWELLKKLDGLRPDADMARVAIDAYLEAVDAGLYEAEVTAIGKATRALEVALSLRDDARVIRARDVLLQLEDRVAEDSSPGLWGFCFDLFVEPPNKRIPITDDQREKLLADLEARLTRFASAPPDQYHPSGAEAAAVRLANFYRRSGRSDDVARVLRRYAEIVRRMNGVAAPLVASHSLEQLYDLVKAFNLHGDADELNDDLRTAGEQAMADMKTISVEKEIPTEQVEAYFAGMLAGTAPEVLVRVAVHFIPNRDELQKQLFELAKQAPISFLMSRAIVDDEGRTVARIGPLESDLEGQLIRHMSETLQFSVPWLRETMRRGVQSQLLTASNLLAFLLEGPLFQSKRQLILESGLSAYIQGDAIAAIHILVPQIEQALRQLAILIGAAIYTQRRGGGLHARTLDDLLRDPALSDALGENVTTYFRVLLTDARGWNIRNNVCHGLAPTGMLTMPVADRVVHALLVLALLRVRSGSD